MGIDEAAQFDRRLRAIEAEQGEQGRKLDDLGQSMRLLVAAVAGPVDGSRAGLAEQVRGHDERLRIIESQPGNAPGRALATHASAGGIGAFVCWVIEWFSGRIH